MGTVGSHPAQLLCECGCSPAFPASRLSREQGWGCESDLLPSWEAALGQLPGGQGCWDRQSQQTHCEGQGQHGLLAAWAGIPPDLQE